MSKGKSLDKGRSGHQERVDATPKTLNRRGGGERAKRPRKARDSGSVAQPRPGRVSGAIPPEKPQRVGGSRASARLVAAARENGKKGGRPRKRRDFGAFDGVESPPRHPLKLGYWMQRVLALDALRVDQGRGDKEVSKALRAYARAMSLIMTPAIMMAALEPDGDWRRAVDGDLAVPEHPFAVAYWFLLRLARGVERVIQGEPDPQGVEIRAHASAYVKIIPPDVMFEAQRRLKREIAELDTDGGPELTPPKEPANGSEQRYRAISCKVRRA